MPCDQPRDAIVIVLDVGKSVSTLHDYEEHTFFQSARNCVSWIIQRKIISQSIDVLSLLLIGSEGSDLPIKCNDYENICGKFDFQLASWDMLKFIEKEIETSNVESDWFGALIVSLEMLKAYQEFNTVSNKKVVIFSDFAKPVSDDLDGIIERIKALNVEVTIIGPEHLQLSAECCDSEPKTKRKKFDKTLEREEGEKVAYRLWREVPENVGVCTFESALKQLCSYVPKPKRLRPWYCIMDVGDVSINICVLKKTDPKPAIKFNTKFVGHPEKYPGQGTSAEEKNAGSRRTAPAVRDTLMYYKSGAEKMNEFVDVEVKPEDTVEGFRYGKTVIPFTEEDKSAMKYETGPQSFSVIGFTHASSVPCYLLSGECSYLVVPKGQDKNAEVALSALVQGMKRTKCLAVVRRVHRHNFGLSLGILYPAVEEIFSDETNEVACREYLLFIELAFEDDVKSVDFPSLETVAKNITQQQYDAVDGLIHEMDLMRADEGLRGEACEAFDSTFLHDYKEQFFHFCVIQRGLHPDKPLPNALPPYIANFIKVPEAVEERCGSVFKNIESQFKIINCGGQTNRWSGKKVNERDEGVRNVGLRFQDQGRCEHFAESFIKEEKNPVTRSWMRLFGRGLPADQELEKLFNAYGHAAESEMSQASKSFGLVMAQVRENYLKRDPTVFNGWMVGFKKYLSEKDGLGPRVWQVIATERLGLIRKEENHLSEVSNDEAAKFSSPDVSGARVPEKRMPDVRLLDELIEEQMNIDFDS